MRSSEEIALSILRRLAADPTQWRLELLSEKPGVWQATIHSECVTVTSEEATLILQLRDKL